MIIKIALTELCPVQPISGNESEGMIRTASGRVLIEPGTDKERIVQAEIKKHPNALFFRAKAIKADEPNSNGDSFSKEELLMAYKSFEGVPFFTNHENQDIEKAKGKIIFAEWDEAENSIYTIAFVDRDAYPHICRGIEQGYMTGVSMGASVEYSVCSICDNKAERTEDYCEHIRNRKSRKFTGKARNVSTGEMKQCKNEPVFEHNYGIKFIELSGVVDPACPSCHIDGIIPNTDYLGKVANMENYLRMVRTAAIEKEASQEELDQINQILETMEGIAVNLIKNRQQVEVEFASELVDIIANLQTWMDELVGAGYGNLQTEVPGTLEEGAPAEAVPAEGMPAEGAPAGGMAPQAAPTPVASEQAMGVGSTTGQPSAPLTNAPTLPISAPMRPAASSNVIRKVAEEGASRFDLGESVLQKTASLCGRLVTTGDKAMGKRRTVASKEKQKEKAMKVLSSSWQEKQNFFEYIKEVPSLKDGNLKLSIKNRNDSFIIVAEDETSDRIQTWTYEDLSDNEKSLISESPKTAAKQFLNLFAKNTNSTREGVERMSKETKEAGANTVLATPEVTTEQQLADNRAELYHGRTGEEEHVVTQKQLDGSITYPRTGEKEVLTESQLGDSDLRLNPRQNSEPEVVTQAQLDDNSGVSPREDDERHTVTQDQLEGNRTGTEPEVVTERQLDSVDAPWARQANGEAQFKTANQHMTAVLDVFASVSLETGATPKELQSIARGCIANTQARLTLATALKDGTSSTEALPFNQRVAYWNSKNVKIATATPTEVELSLVNKLKVVASDVAINPDVVIDAIDVLSDGELGEQSISNKVDEKLTEASTEVEATVSVKDELRNALKEAATEDDSKSDEDEDDVNEDDEDEDDVVEAKAQRDVEREEILASLNEEPVVANTNDEILNPEKLNGADSVIETSFEELGTTRTASTFRRDLVSFAKGALAGENMKLASITNVTIDGNTIQIAVQTDSGEETVNIPIGEEIAPLEEEIVPEGDLSGEGLEGGLDDMGMTSVDDAALASVKNKMQRVAQSPMGGGMDGAGGGVSAPGAPEQGLEGPAPGEDVALQSLTNGDDEMLEDEVPTVGEKQAPWSICPECGSADVDVTKEDDGGIIGQCNGCGAEYEALVKKTIEFKIIKPTKSAGEEGEELPEGPEAPEEMPALPVAAQTRIDKGSIVRIAANKEANGEVCPSCGNTHCDVVASGNGCTECNCGSCGTSFEKNLIISSTDPSQGFLRVEWDTYADDSCPECKEEARKFASRIKVAGLLKTANSNADQFPVANCIERLARTYGGNTVARFGPCKDKPMADCVCRELQRLGFTKVKQMKKLAEVVMQKDPMDACLEDQSKRGHDVVQATSICNCIKKKFAKEASDNLYLQAFAEDAGSESVPFSKFDFETLAEAEEARDDHLAKKAQAMIDDLDIGDDLDPLDSIDVEIDEVVEEADELESVQVDSVTITGDNLEVVENTATDDVSDDIAEDVAFEDTVEEGEEDMEGLDHEALAEALAMNSSRVRRSGDTNLKLASAPKQVETIEGNVEAGVPRSKATIRNEGADNIDVPMAKPSVPRSSALMGHEQNVPAGLPNVAVDSSYMGVEKGLQAGMPAINNQIKGTVIAKQLKEVDTVEGDVEAGVPRGDATIGHEGSDNIDVAMASPSVPRSNATMGNEGKDNIDVSATGPDVPMGDAYMGGEKDAQKGMPSNNDEMLKQVQMANREKQLERIASARRDEAVRTTAWLASNQRIASDRGTFDNVVNALSTFEVDKISTVAESMFPVVKTASTQQVVKTAGVNLPAIVLESQAPIRQEASFQDKLEGSFTIGSQLLNNKLQDDNQR